MRVAKKVFFVLLGILLTYVFVRFVVWQLPGTLADVLSDSETNLKDLEKISGTFQHENTFWKPLIDFFSFHWGTSQLYAENSLPIVMRHFHVTLWLCLYSLFFTLLFSLGFFLFKPKFSQKFSNLLLALPGIAVYPAVVFIFCMTTSFCPAGSVLQGRALLLAALAQGFLTSPRFYRELEWEIDEIRRQRFVLVLRAKGLSYFKIWSQHIFMNALAPFLSLLVLTTLSFFSGAILVEALFDLPGIGLLLVEAIKSRDFNLIFPLVMFLSLLHLVTLQSGKYLKVRRMQHE